MKLSKVFPLITFLVLVGSFGLSVFDIHEVSETEINFVIILVGSFGMGGLCKKVIRDGFTKFKQIQEEIIPI